ELDELLRHSMQRDPQHRPASVIEMVHQLQLVQERLGVPVTQLEIAEEEWAPQLTEGSLSGNRGPVRSPVAHTPRRVAKTERASRAGRYSTAEGADERFSTVTLSRGKIVALIAGTVLVTATVVLVATALLGSGV